jgi:two-component system, NtrC family, sensor histidine kinase PilS
MDDTPEMVKQPAAAVGYGLYLSRLVVMLAVAVIVVAFYIDSESSFQRHTLVVLAAIGVLSFMTQLAVLRLSHLNTARLVSQLAPDLLLVGGLVFATSGIQSPFSFLIGLIVIAMGMYADFTLVLVFSIVGCAVYLVAVYSFGAQAMWQPSVADTLHILLQTSAFLLVGGAMAAIARRQNELRARGQAVERRHQSLQDLHAQAMSTMREGMLVLGGDLLVHDANPAAQRILGTSQPLVGRAAIDIFSGQPGLQAFFHQARRDMFQFEWKRREQVCLVTIAPLPSDDTERAWLITLVDLSERRALERRLNEQEKLAALGRMSAMLAHELRNPLQTIGQAVELLTTQKKRNDGLKVIIGDEIRRLNRLVTDLLTYTTPLKPAPDEVRPAELLEAAVRQVDIDGRHGVSWQTDLEALALDPGHFRLVLDNLLRNALEASPEPGTVRVELGQMNEHPESWLLEVSDQGSGVDEAVKKHLFEPFARGRPGGTGLGLATVWQVCRANDWAVSVDSSAAGTRFSISGNIRPEQLKGGKGHG